LIISSSRCSLLPAFINGLVGFIFESFLDGRVVEGKAQPDFPSSFHRYATRLERGDRSAVAFERDGADRDGDRAFPTGREHKSDLDLTSIPT